ncbi:MAG: hypothetical protein JNM62_00615 [Flavobacteriales bacterium]|nr:hypothetical protein [Flavobacteriales bacterium]
MKILRTAPLFMLSMLNTIPAMAQGEEEIAPVIIQVDPDLSRDLVAYPSEAPVTPFVAEVLARTTNRFIGTATMHYTRVYHGNTTSWTVRYVSTADSMVLISHSDEPLPTVRTTALVIDRTRKSEVYHSISLSDSTVKHWTRNLPIRPYGESFLPDSLEHGTRDVLGRSCVKRVHEGSMFKRTAWLDPAIPSLYMDLLSVRGSWDAMDHIVIAYHLISADDAMPMLVEFAYGTEDQYTLRILDIKPDAVDPQAFTISKDSWNFK